MFFKKKKRNLDEEFKELYKQTNRITSDAGNELDYEIKYSHLELACVNYDKLLKLIDEGANFEKEHFQSLKESVEKERNRIKRLLDEN